MQGKKIDSITIKELFEENQSATLPILLDIQHDLIRWEDESLGQEQGHLRLINSNVAVKFGGWKYMPAFFQFTQPQEESNKIGQTSITISALDRRIIRIIRSITTAPKAVIDALYAKISENEFAFSRRCRYEFAMSSVSWDSTTAKWTLIFDKTMQNNIPRDLATAPRVPAITANEV